MKCTAKPARRKGWERWSRCPQQQRELIGSIGLRRLLEGRGRAWVLGSLDVTYLDEVGRGQD